jgi:hypothetical protein
MAALLSATQPTPPARVDYFSGVDAWGMLGNDQYGDCVEAGICHIVEQDSDYATGTEQVLGDADALGLYAAITGFNPDDPNTDQGTYTQDAYMFWRKVGAAGHQIAAYASVTLDDWTMIGNAVNQFGQVGIGFNFPASAMDQFNAGQPWTVVNGSPIDGGHYVVLVGYDADWLYVVTWGQVQKMARAFWAKYVDEAWVSITQDTVTAQGANAYGGILDLAALGAAFAALTGQPNPFPNVDPTPIPVPVPVPTPVPDPTPTPTDVVDAELWQHIKPWTREHHLGQTYEVSKRLRAWAKAKGL